MKSNIRQTTAMNQIPQSQAPSAGTPKTSPLQPSTCPVQPWDRSRSFLLFVAPKIIRRGPWSGELRMMQVDNSNVVSMACVTFYSQLSKSKGEGRGSNECVKVVADMNGEERFQLNIKCFPDAFGLAKTGACANGGLAF